MLRYYNLLPLQSALAAAISRANGFARLTTLAVLAVGLLHTAPVLAITITLDDFRLAPPSRDVNTLNVTMTGSGFLGTSRDTSRLTGSVRGLLDLDFTTGDPIATGFSFTGGLVNAENMSFSFVGGLLSATSNNVAGVPFTDNPPGVVVNGRFDATQHGITLNQGTVNSTSANFDLSEDPVVTNGTGEGTLIISAVGPPVEGSQTYNLQMRLPVLGNDSFVLTDVPIIGEAVIDITANGTIVAEQTFVIEGLAGDYDYNRRLDCADIALLSGAVTGGNSDPRYDADGSGSVTGEDIVFWVQSLRKTVIGDANLDGVVNDADWATIETNLFQSELNWCRGDFNVDGRIDGTDANIWSAQRGLQAPASTAAVPEPHAAVVLGIGAIATLARMRKPRRPNVR